MSEKEMEIKRDTTHVSIYSDRKKEGKTARRHEVGRQEGWCVDTQARVVWEAGCCRVLWAAEGVWVSRWNWWQMFASKSFAEKWLP